MRSLIPVTEVITTSHEDYHEIMMERDAILVQVDHLDKVYNKREIQKHVAQESDLPVYDISASDLILMAREDAVGQLNEMEFDWLFEKVAQPFKYESDKVTHMNVFGIALLEVFGPINRNQRNAKDLYWKYRTVELMDGFINGADSFYPFAHEDARNEAKKWWNDFRAKDLLDA